MVVSVRTKYPEIFFIFYKTFTSFYQNEDVHVFIDLGEDEGEDSSIKRINDYERINEFFFENKITGKFKIHLISRKSKPTEGLNHYANLLYWSLQFRDVISFDDDIVWLSGGFFDELKSIPNNTIFGQKYMCMTGNQFDNKKVSIASYCLGGKGVDFSNYNKYFPVIGEQEKLDYFSGNDAFKILEANDRTIFIDDINPILNRSPIVANSITTKYYHHMSSMTWSLRSHLGIN